MRTALALKLIALVSLTLLTTAPRAAGSESLEDVLEQIQQEGGGRLDLTAGETYTYTSVTGHYVYRSFVKIRGHYARIVLGSGGSSEVSLRITSNDSISISEIVFVINTSGPVFIRLDAPETIELSDVRFESLVPDPQIYVEIGAADPPLHFNTPSEAYAINITFPEPASVLFLRVASVNYTVVSRVHAPGGLSVLEEAIGDNGRAVFTKSNGSIDIDLRAIEGSAVLKLSALHDSNAYINTSWILVKDVTGLKRLLVESPDEAELDNVSTGKIGAAPQAGPQRAVRAYRLQAENVSFDRADIYHYDRIELTRVTGSTLMLERSGYTVIKISEIDRLVSKDTLVVRDSRLGSLEALYGQGPRPRQRGERDGALWRASRLVLRRGPGPVQCGPLEPLEAPRTRRAAREKGS